MGGAGGALALAGGVVLIGAVLAGNALVCVSVAAERALQTPASHFILSLAAADLLLAVLVLPLFVYSEVQGGVWRLSPGLCDLLMALDVMLCTASIFNLCAISVDRFVAVALPLRYADGGAGRRRLLIAGAWLLAAAVAAPLLGGLNARGRAPAAPPECRLEDRAYVLGSSLCSFFLPCPLMLLLYAAAFRRLRRRGAQRRAGLGARGPPLESQGSWRVPPESQGTREVPPESQGTREVPPESQGVRGVPPENQGAQEVPPETQGAQGVPPESQGAQEVPPESQGARDVPPQSEGTRGVPLESQGSQDVSPKSQGALDKLPEIQRPQDVPPESQGARDVFPESQGAREVPVKTEDAQKMSPETEGPHEPPTETQRPQEPPPESGDPQESSTETWRLGDPPLHTEAPRGSPPRAQLVPVGGPCRAPLKAQPPNGPTPDTQFPRAETPEPETLPRGRRAVSRRERKAMRVLLVVVGVFLLCWTPFFVVHVTRALCAACAVSPGLVSAVTWLGYANSALNPLVYTAFNSEFRAAFRRALRRCC